MSLVSWFIRTEIDVKKVRFDGFELGSPQLVEIAPAFDYECLFTMESYMSSIGSRLQMLTTSDHASVVSMNLFVALLCACIVIGHLLEENRWMNESITALIIGLCTGVVILLISFRLKRKQFFRNFMTIMLFGAVGTLISCFIISVGTDRYSRPAVIYLFTCNALLFYGGAMQFFKKLDIGPLDIGDYLAIGAIFAATDSVCTLQVCSIRMRPLLYSLVFGEGVVNDATSVVLFNAIQSFDLTNINAAIAWDFARNFFYLFLASTLLGVVVKSPLLIFLSAPTGLISAYIIRRLYFGRHSTDREVALMMLMAYLSYMLAELFYLSGILTVFFCGIEMSHYTWHNVTESSRVTTKHAFATLSFVAETFIFLYVGMDALDIEKWRFVSHSPGTSVAFIIWWAGQMRGAVSMALAYNKFTSAGHTHLRGNAIMITSTITVVLFQHSGK
ncbi:sodium/hydrogen exchanger 1-like [Populus alba x Populus x berolinensis]|nr:sodium/hydrogen exchanger 1-like [Populus alba x Populus x berolinensis]